ncbi:PAS domain-containing protein [Corallococcus sp. M34]|nr:PAS domain-containing protein [Citreicoccus inhibens]
MGVQWGLAATRVSPPFLLFLVAVCLARRWAGTGPAWLATGLSALLSLVLTIQEPATAQSHTEVGAGLFLLLCALIVHCPERRPLAAEFSARAASWSASLLHALPDAFVATDMDGRVCAFNSAASRLTGWSVSNALGQPLARVLRLMRQDTREPLADLLGDSACPKGDSVSVRPCVLERMDGSVLSVEVNLAPAPARTGPMQGGWLLLVRDASSRHWLEAERARWLAREHAALREAQSTCARQEAMLTQAPIALFTFRGPEHRCESLNPAAHALLSERSVLGRPVRELLPEGEAVLVRCLDEVYRSGEPFVSREVTLSLKSPVTACVEPRAFALTCQPWHDTHRSLQGVICLAVETTDAVRARRASEAQAEALRAALETRDEFLSIASHELKTPLTSLQLQLQLLARAVAGRASEGEASPLPARVRAAQRQVARLALLVATLLDLSRIRAGRLELEPEQLDLSALVTDLASRCQEDATSAGCLLNLQVTPGVVGFWDRLKLEQILTNLLSNAFKYGAAHPVEVTVDHDDARARVIVRDHGIGIDLEHQVRIFERFERAVYARDYGGVGLGLWISRKLARSLEGDIRVESVLGEGSTFIVQLPLRPLASISV